MQSEGNFNDWIKTSPSQRLIKALSLCQVTQLIEQLIESAGEEGH